MELRRRAWGLHVSVLLLYVVLSLLLTMPMAAHFTTHVPGDGIDDPALAWNLWWVKYSLVDLGANPFDCRYMFYPLGINLAFYTLTVLNGVLSIPLQGVLPLIATSNVLLLLNFVLAAFGAYLLALDMLVRRPRAFSLPAATAGAFFAGLVYAFSSSKLFYASLGQFNIASSGWIPFYALMLLHMGRNPHRLHYPILAALFLIFQAWAELTFASFLAVFTALYLVLAILDASRRRPHAGRLLRREEIVPWLRDLLLLGVIFVIGIAPILGNMLPDMRAEGDFFVVGTGFAETFSSDLVGYLVPTQLNPWFGGLVDGFEFPHDKAQHYFLGYGVMALGLIGFIVGRRRADVRLWAVSALGFFLLTLGPTLRINGHDTRIPLPFQIFQVLPFFKGNRYPSRYGVLLVLCMGMLAGLGLAWAWDRSAARRRVFAPALASVAVFVFLLEHLSVPLPLSDLRVPPAYDALVDDAAGRPDTALLDLPIGWRNGFRVTGIMDPIFMYAQFYQTHHHLPILGGNTSRNPEISFQYFTETPVLNSLIALESGHALPAEHMAQDRLLAPQIMDRLNIGHVMLHKPTAGEALHSYVEDVLPLERIYEDGEYVLYRRNGGQTGGTTALRAAEPAARPALGQGWGFPSPDGGVWTAGGEARLILPLAPETSRLTLELRAPQEVRLSIRLNTCRLGTLDIGPQWGRETIVVPAGCAHGMDDLWLSAESLVPVSPALAPPETRDIGGTGVRAPANITVRSAGKDVGDFGHIFIDGVDYSPNQRGYNLVVIDPTTGDVLQRASFDTHLDPSASARLTAFVRDLPAGIIVAVAAMDEASLNLGEDAVHALWELGLSGNLRGCFRWSHAAVGVKGAPAGTAAEVLSETWPATVAVGGGFVKPQTALELRHIQWEERTAWGRGQGATPCLSSPSK